MDLLWTEALSKGLCPLAGCDITQATCEHLDAYLDYGPQMFGPTPSVFYTDQIERYPGEESKDPTTGSWDLYKKLRRTGLDNDQILILIDRFAVGSTFRQIMEARNYTSMQTLLRRFNKALEHLKRRGYDR